MRLRHLGLATLALVPAALFAVSIPHSFSNGEVADATAVNANFTALGTATTTLETKLDGLGTRVVTNAAVLKSPDGTRCVRVAIGNGANAVREAQVDCTTYQPLALTLNGASWQYPDGSVAASCAEYLDSAAYTTQGSGTYWIDPDGTKGPTVAFETYCDMVTAGGGWTFFAHVNSNYVGSTLFSRDVGTFVAARTDNNLTYGAGGRILQALPHTEMMVTLDSANPVTAQAASKLVFFRYPVGYFPFNNGPVPCFGLGYQGWGYRLTPTGAWTFGGESNSCDGGAWYTRNPGNTAYLVLFNSGSSYGNYWGAGMGGNDTWNHDGWWYAR